MDAVPDLRIIEPGMALERMKSISRRHGRGACW